MSDTQALHLTNQNFQDTLTQAGDKPVMVDFFAEWCGPCKMAAPVIEELAGEYKDKAVVAKVDVDENRELAMQFNVMSIPTVVMFKNGQVVGQPLTGFSGKQGYVQMLEKALAE